MTETVFVQHLVNRTAEVVEETDNGENNESCDGQQFVFLLKRKLKLL